MCHKFVAIHCETSPRRIEHWPICQLSRANPFESELPLSYHVKIECMAQRRWTNWHLLSLSIILMKSCCLIWVFLHNFKNSRHSGHFLETKKLGWVCHSCTMRRLVWRSEMSRRCALFSICFKHSSSFSICFGSGQQIWSYQLDFF